MVENGLKNVFREKRLSIIIPAYNEEKRVGPTLKSIIDFMKSREWQYELLVVDDGSADATVETARQAARDAPLRIIQNKTNMGKGASVKAGMLEAAGDAILFTDADLSTPIEEIDKLIPYWIEGAGVVFGSRSVAGAEIVVHQNLLREYMGRTFNLFVRAVALPGYIDTQCGFKLFSAECAKRVFPQQRLMRFAFDVEVLTVARRLGFSIREVPVTWHNDPSSKVSVMSSPLEMIFGVLKLKWNLIRGIYK